jgi:hypothetical protein
MSAQQAQPATSTFDMPHLASEASPLYTRNDDRTTIAGEQLWNTPHKSQFFITEMRERIDPTIMQSGSVLVCKTLLVDMQISEPDDSLTSLVYWLPLRLSS